MTNPVLAFDFGGTKLAAALVDPENGQILSSVQLPTPVGLGASASLEDIIRAGNQALFSANVHKEQIQGIGISFGGPISQDRRMVLRSMHVKSWELVNLPDRIAEYFGRPTMMDNDANAAALGEWIFGTGNKIPNMLYIQISTGIGAGLILESKLYRGSGLAGELGHIPVLLDGPECPCGKRGCLESLASGWAIGRDGGLLASQEPAGILNRLAQNLPAQVTAEMVVQACQEGDLGSRGILQQAFRFLAMGIAQAICLVDPELVILGGGVARAEGLMKEMMLPGLAEFLPSLLQNRCRIEFSRLKGLETLIGAALLTRGY